MDEEPLVRAARRGEREAFDRLVERYSRVLLARQLGWTGDLAAAEDLAQETFLRAWQRLGQLEDIRAFGSWLLSIGGFVGQEWLRRKRLEQKVRGTLVPALPARREEGIDPALARALSELAPEVQQLLAMRHDAGLSCDEIAEKLGRPLGTVTKTLSRAYEQLRSRLAQQ